MPSRLRMTVVLAAAGLIASACDNPKPRNPVPPLPVGDSAPPSSIAERLPAWAGEMIGKPLAGFYPEPSGICVGNADVIQDRFAAPTPGVEIVGWGWDPSAKAPISRILVVDSVGVIVGAGEPGISRPDVTAARPDVTAPDTGWSAVTDRTTGTVDLFGVVDGGKALCRSGRMELG